MESKAYTVHLHVTTIQCCIDICHYSLDVPKLYPRYTHRSAYAYAAYIDEQLYIVMYDMILLIRVVRIMLQISTFVFAKNM